MKVYFAFIVVILIANEEKRINNDIPIVKTHIEPYRDSSYNKIDVSSYCKSRTCVLKCCPNGEDLNSEGNCTSSRYVKGSGDRINYVVNVDKWDKVVNDSEEITRKYDQRFVQNKSMSENVGDVWLFDYYVLKDGSIRIKVNNATVKWVGASPLNYCINNNLAEVLSKEFNLSMIFKLVAQDEESTGPRIFIFVFIGMIALLLLFGFTMYLLSSVLLRIMGLSLLAFICTVIAAYITTTVQLLALNARIVNSSECRILGPFTYLFILSAFFWADVLAFDTWWKIRNFRIYSIETNKEVDPDKFIRRCMFGWVIPILMTVVAVAVDILKLDALLPFVKPPFDSCLGSENHMLIYMYIPIAMLTALNAIFFLLNLYNIFRLQLSYDNVEDISKVLIGKHRFSVRIKLYIIITLSGGLILINLPSLVIYTIHVYNIVIGAALFILFVYERCVHDIPYTSYNICEDMNNLYRRLSGTVTVRTTVSDLVNERNNANRGNISMSAPIISMDANDNRY